MTTPTAPDTNGLASPETDELPQMKGERTNKMQRHTTKSERDYFETRVATLTTMPGSKISDQERRERLTAAEWYKGYLDGEVTKHEAHREQLRVDAKWFLKQTRPLAEFPADRAAIAYALMRQCVENTREKADAGEKALWRHGESVFKHWYRPIPDEFSHVHILFWGLSGFGDHTDSKAMTELADRGETLAAWLMVRYDINRSRPAGARDIPFLPRFYLIPAACDRWWMGAGSMGKNVLGWWSLAVPHKRRVLRELADSMTPELL